jgi:hypothetical protein
MFVCARHVVRVEFDEVRLRLPNECNRASGSQLKPEGTRMGCEPRVLEPDRMRLATLGIPV